ncbi:hypothetical protein [Burkholderia pyrrocinia]|uniref:hypothetical protein n=1 Tax=Burkholderia pyrrocinia TaxID=60550 RepID=UPI001BCD2496|nr:hypothetical protein [Burkholderia pyrrocinia]QVN23839.1 hypothetical protein JYG32_33360 [Burkholderia pyrrocinia]
MLVASLLPVSAAYASSDGACEPTATLRPSGFSCGGIPILSPGNDSRINAMLLMADGGRLAQVFPDPGTIPPAVRTSRLVVPFSYDFSGWIDIGQKQPDTADGARAEAYADGEGNICRSMASGNKAFDDALTAAKDLPGGDAARLRTARADIAKTCAAGGAGTTWAKPAGIKSALGQQFATYLDGAHAFYRNDFVSATKSFASASSSTDPWLKDAGLYMTGRAQLNVAQAGAFNTDGSGAMNPANVNKIALGAADTVFRVYLNAYPHGRYATSAVGLQRRIAWLGGNAARQAELYDRAFTDWSEQTSNVQLGQLANELDSKLLQTPGLDSGQLRSPSLLAIVDLMRMSTPDVDGPTGRKPMSLNELLAQKPRFAGAPALHDYLVATYHVFVDHKPDDALALLPQAPGVSLDYLGLSQQMLRGFALEDSGRANKARQLWAQLIPLAKYRLQREALELALAINLEQAGLVDRVFADDSPIQNAGIRAALLQHTAGADLLRAQAQNEATGGALRDIALYSLLYKELTRAQYPAFIADLALISGKPSDPLKPFALAGIDGDAGYACPSPRDVAAALQQNPADPKGLNCLAEFVRRNPPAYPLVGEPATTRPMRPATLGSMPSQFPGKVFERIGNYLTVIGNAQAPADDRAYALYRAIHCFAPAGYSDCGGNDIPRGTRKKWFDMLKSAYPRSKWAQSQKYYW